MPEAQLVFERTLLEVTPDLYRSLEDALARELSASARLASGPGLAALEASLEEDRARMLVRADMEVAEHYAHLADETTRGLFGAIAEALFVTIHGIAAGLQTVG